MTVPCPACSGMQMVDHPAGWLAWDHANICTLRDAEDSRHVADVELLIRRRLVSRPATLTEETLLGALGHTIPTSSPLVTEVRRVTGSIVNRRWPQIEATPTTGGTPT